MPAAALPVVSQDFRRVFPRLPDPPADPPIIDDAARSCVRGFRALDTHVHTDRVVSNEDIVGSVPYQATVMAEFAGEYITRVGVNGSPEE